MKLIKKEDIQFKLTKKNLITFIKEWKSLNVRTDLKKMVLMNEIINDDKIIGKI
jgi:hypothetical protein